MKRQWYALFILFLLSVGMVFGAMKENYGKETVVPKYPVHWLPPKFDGNVSHCKFGIVVTNWKHDLVCVHYRGSGGHGLSVDVSAGSIITVELPATNDTGNETNSTG